MIEFGDITISFSEIMTPIVMLLLSYLLTLWIKDLLTKLAKGLVFKFDNSFNEGDSVIIDGESAIIVKIGITNTVFGITKENGQYSWRYVPNEQISFLKLEKIILK